MPTLYDAKLAANIITDDAGEIRGINHVDSYPEMEQGDGHEATAAYVRQIAERLNIEDAALHDLDRRVSYVNPQQQDVAYRFSEAKVSFDTATYAYYQTYLNTPVWQAGITATVKQSPTRILSATNTTQRGVDAEMPSREAIERYQNLFAAAEKVDGRRRSASDNPAAFSGAAAELLDRILGDAGRTGTDIKGVPHKPRLIRGRFFIYQYDPAQRSVGTRQGDDDEEPFCGTPPTLPLPPVPDQIKPGRWYLVAELIFRLPIEGMRMNWRVLVEVETNAILYLRALASGINGNVFVYDPITSTGTTTNTPDQTDAVLNPRRTSVVLPNLDAAVGGTQSLTGSLVALTDIEILTLDPPTRPEGSNFDTYDVRTNEFAAVNAYYHADRFFQLVENLGFPRATYFDGTAFPVEVDHRGKGTAANMGNVVNAHCVGDADGIDHACFALAHTGDTTHPIGIATDWRVVLHELGGHGTLEDHVGSPNFGFAHSAGDSFAMIMNDYLSEWHNGAALDRFLLAPFVPAVVRRSDRTIADGWGWGGVHDTGINLALNNPGYESEQVLSTTMFRFYRSIGGDATSVVRREFAARCTAYLLLRAIGGLTAMSNPANAAGFLAALITADAGNWTSEGVYGGAYNKVLTWAFEEQNLNGGALPPVDVYIDDGRAGEYQYLPVHWDTQTIWNRWTNDDLEGHQPPVLGVPNYAYVKIKNRGTSIANDVVVKGFHCQPSAGVTWPADFQPFTTPQISAGTLNPNNTQEKIVGPFTWTPVTNAWGHDCMLMIVSATGDPSNVDNFTAGEFVEDWRLVPNDNNVAQRNVVFSAGGGGGSGMLAELQHKGFWVGNTSRKTANIKVSIGLPGWLDRRGWAFNVRGIPAEGLRLKSNEKRLVTFDLHAGKSFTQAEVRAESERDIVVTATADGAIIGGMTYHLDPEITKPINDGAEQPARKGWATINWPRLLLGVLVAGIICFVSDGFFHERVVTSDWRAIYAGLRASEVAHSAYGLFYFALFELGRALIALWVYALMRSMCKPGWQTAAVAGVIMWLAFSVTGPAQFIPLGFYSPALWIKVAAFQLVTSIIATIAGAAIYKEA